MSHILLELMTLISFLFSACTLSRGTFRRNIPITLHSTTYSTLIPTSGRKIYPMFISSAYKKSTQIRKMSLQASSNQIHGSKRSKTFWSHSSMSWRRQNKCKVFCWRFSLSELICIIFERLRVNTPKLDLGECGWVVKATWFFFSFRDWKKKSFSF